MLIAQPTSRGDVTLLWRAATLLAIPVDAVIPHRRPDCSNSARRFASPSADAVAVYRAASEGDRRKAHEVLAEAMIGDTDADYRAWHGRRRRTGWMRASLPSSRAPRSERGARRLAAAGAFLSRSMD